MFSFIAITFLTAYYLQHFLLLPPWKCGLYFLPITLCFASGSFFASKIITKLPLVHMIYLGGILSAIGAFALGFLSPTYMKLQYLILPMIIFGLGFGMFAPLNNYYTMQITPPSFVGFSISFSYMAGLIFSSFSISLCGIFVTKIGWLHFYQAVKEKGLSVSDQTENAASLVLAGSQNLDTISFLAPELKEAFFFAYQIDMFLCASLIALSFFIIRLTKISHIDYTI
jgi:MFS family permease